MTNIKNCKNVGIVNLHEHEWGKRDENVYDEDWRDGNDFSLTNLCENMMVELLIVANSNENSAVKHLKHTTYDEEITKQCISYIDEDFSDEDKTMFDVII